MENRGRDPKVDELLGRAALDHSFCHQLLEDPEGACRSYGLEPNQYQRVTALLQASVPRRRPGKRSRLATAGTLVLSTFLLASSAAFAHGDCRECPSQEQSGHPLKTDVVSLDAGFGAPSGFRLEVTTPGGPSVSLANPELHRPETNAPDLHHPETAANPDLHRPETGRR